MVVRRSCAAANRSRSRWVRCDCSAIAFLVVCGALAACVVQDALRAAEHRKGLVLEYRFEGGAADSSGNAFHGTIHGRPQYVPGKTGQCVQLDGQQDYVDSGTTLADLGQTFTIECWVNPAEHQNPNADIFGNHSGGGCGFVVEQSADNTNCFAGAYGAGGGQWIGMRPIKLAANTSEALPAFPPRAALTRVVSLDGDDWFLATDPRNEGRQGNWPASPVPDVRPAQVPWPLQDAFPDYHGVAWYWRHFTPPVSPFPDGRYLLRFHAVDYLAEVWVNGTCIGSHEGGETPFVLDATGACQPGAQNTLAVRVLNPTYDPIDGMALKQTASGAKQYPVTTNSAYNCGGILDSVELLLAPAVRVEDLHGIPDWKTGEIRVRTNVWRTAAQPTQGMVQLTAAPATGGESLASQYVAADLAPGDTLVEAVLRVPDHRLWQLHDPYLYRVTARVRAVGSEDADEQTVRCGFRDFRFENATDSTAALCPVSLATCGSGTCRPQTAMVQSRLPEANLVPSDENASDCTASV